MTHEVARPSNSGEIAARREAARSLVGNQASTATKYGGDSRHCCFETYGPQYWHPGVAPQATGPKRLATSSSITSVAPPPIASTRASRTSRSIGLSRM